jgi:hypothetical protein
MKTKNQTDPYKRVVAARINALNSEKLFLQRVHDQLTTQWRLVDGRLAAIDRQIAQEKASVE